MKLTISQSELTNLVFAYLKTTFKLEHKDLDIEWDVQAPRGTSRTIEATVLIGESPVHNASKLAHEVVERAKVNTSVEEEESDIRSEPAIVPGIF